jgi:hypothetical protein
MSCCKMRGMKTAVVCPFCQSTDDNRSTGLVRLANGSVAEERQCDRCGEKWTIDVAGEVRDPHAVRPGHCSGSRSSCSRSRG